LTGSKHIDGERTEECINRERVDRERIGGEWTGRTLWFSLDQWYRDRKSAGGEAGSEGQPVSAL
jgi:hypothetical protein